MSYLNKTEFEYLNILKWHKLGYTGKGIKIANFESANINLHYFNNVKDPFGIGRNNDFSNRHGNKTLDILTQVAPSSQFYILSNAMQQNNKTVTGEMMEQTIPFIRSEGIDLVNASLIGYSVDAIDRELAILIENGVSFVTSSGNTGEGGLGAYAQSENWISVGAVGLSGRGGIYLKNYSSIGESLDVVSFSGLNVHDSRKGYEDRIFREEGTSFSSPLLCGMLALVQQFFKEKVGRTLKQDELLEFVKDNSIDLGDVGKDHLYGYGLFVLPNPEDVDTDKYLGKKEEEVKVDNKNTFTDVDANSWYSTAIEWITKKGRMKGYKDNSFRPNQPLTRAEYAQAEYNKALQSKEGL